MKTKTCTTCKYRVAGTGFYDPGSCLLWGGRCADHNAAGHRLGHTYSLRTWLFQRWVDRRPRA